MATRTDQVEQTSTDDVDARYRAAVVRAAAAIELTPEQIRRVAALLNGRPADSGVR